jgi:hypothetical protein
MYTEFALGPSVRVTVATGDDGEEVIARAALSSAKLPGNQR